MVKQGIIVIKLLLGLPGPGLLLSESLEGSFGKILRRVLLLLSSNLPLLVAESTGDTSCALGALGGGFNDIFKQYSFSRERL